MHAIEIDPSSALDEEQTFELAPSERQFGTVADRGPRHFRARCCGVNGGRRSSVVPHLSR